MAQTRIIDSDGHIFEDAPAIIRFLPSPWKEIARTPDFRGLFPPLDSLHTGQAPRRNSPGSFRRDVGANEWLEFMDAVGIETAVLYPTSGLAYGKITDADWACAVARGYNDWLWETYLSKSPRFRGMGLIPLQEPETGAVELRRVVKGLGMCGAMLLSNGMKAPVGDKEYWPVYAEADRLGCCLAIHGGCMMALAWSG